MKKTMLAIQITLGFMLCWIIFWAWLYYFPLPEVQYPDGYRSIGWHFALVALGVALASQCLSHLVFRRLSH